MPGHPSLSLPGRGAFSFSVEYRIPADHPPPVWITQTYVLAMLLGTLLGGYVTARVARQPTWRNVLILAVLCFSFQLAFWRVPANALLFEVIRMVLIASMALLGGHVHLCKRTDLAPV